MAIGIATTHGTDDSNYSSFFPSLEQAEANALLIAAAPDGLAANIEAEEALGNSLQWLRDNLQPLWRTGSASDAAECEAKLAAIESAWTACAKAIAKATGNTSADL